MCKNIVGGKSETAAFRVTCSKLASSFHSPAKCRRHLDIVSMQPTYKTSKYRLRKTKFCIKKVETVKQSFCLINQQNRVNAFKRTHNIYRIL